MAEKQGSGSPGSAIGGLLAFVAGGFVGWLLGELLAARFTHGANALQGWVSWRMQHAQGIGDIPLNLVGIVVSFFFTTFSLLFELAHRFYLTALIGAGVGSLDSPWSRFFRGVGQAMQGGATLTTVSAVEVVTIRGVRNKLWALIPVVLAVGLVAFLVKAAHHFVPPEKPAVEQFMRFQPQPTWTTRVSGRAIDIELRSVELEPKRLGAVVRFTSKSRREQEVVVYPASNIRPDYDRTNAGPWTTASGTDGRFPLNSAFTIPRNGYIEGTVYFERPREVFVPWRLTVYAGRPGTPPMQSDNLLFFFQLAENTP